MNTGRITVLIVVLTSTVYFLFFLPIQQITIKYLITLIFHTVKKLFSSSSAVSCIHLTICWSYLQLLGDQPEFNEQLQSFHVSPTVSIHKAGQASSLVYIYVNLHFTQQACSQDVAHCESEHVFPDVQQHTGVK